MPNWTQDTIIKLLLTMIDTKSSPPWPEVAEKMGEEYTAEACRMKYRQLKSKSDALTKPSSSTESNGEPKTPNAPRRQGAAKRKAEDDDDDDEDGVDTPTPTPKKKRAGSRSKAPAKGALGKMTGDSFQPMTMEQADRFF